MGFPKFLACFSKSLKVTCKKKENCCPKAVSESEALRLECSKNLAKIVMVKAKGRDAMVVIPCDRQIDFVKLSNALGTDDLRISDDEEVDFLFPDNSGSSEMMGDTYKLPCYADKSLEGQKFLYFQAGYHKQIVPISAADFIQGAYAFVGDFTSPGDCFARYRSASHKAAV